MKEDSMSLIGLGVSLAQDEHNTGHLCVCLRHLWFCVSRQYKTAGDLPQRGDICTAKEKQGAPRQAAGAGCYRPLGKKGL